MGARTKVSTATLERCIFREALPVLHRSPSQLLTSTLLQLGSCASQVRPSTMSLTSQTSTAVSRSMSGTTLPTQRG